MKRLVLILLVVSVALWHSITVAYALYDPRSVPNNFAGVHILNPEEIEDSAKLVNSNGGKWGYITVPIQPSERNKDVWQTFMQKAKELQVIPVIRITTIPDGGTWEKADDTDLVDFANFLNELDWPIENRYIILFNEVNRETEWGGEVNPEKYASIVKNAYTIFKERSPDFFLLGPSLDSALPNSSSSLSAERYLKRMAAFDPLIWTYFDGWSSHSYPNPAFSASPRKTGLQSIVGYKSELALLSLASKPIFITETGWDQTKVSANNLRNYWSQAWQIWQSDANVVAVTPFILRGGEQFNQFSLINSDGNYTPSGQSIYDQTKFPGQPLLAQPKEKPSPSPMPADNSWKLPFFDNNPTLIRLENIFRVILGLPIKSHGTLRDIDMTLELAQTPKQWETGLSNRSDLGDLDGMLFIFNHHHVPLFWMKNMQFPIDIIWISDGKVVDITPNVPVSPSDKLPTYSPREPINMVLETRAGWAVQNNIQLGDTLILAN